MKSKLQIAWSLIMLGGAMAAAGMATAGEIRTPGAHEASWQQELPRPQEVLRAIQVRESIGHRLAAAANLLAAAKQPDAPASGVRSEPAPKAVAAAPGPTRPAGTAVAPLGTIVVLFPDIGEPYRSVFLKIIDGIQEKARGQVSSIPVGSNFNLQDITYELKRLDAKVVVALGRQGIRVASALDRSLPVITAGVAGVPEGDSTGAALFTLAPDPTLLFERLRRFMPDARRVWVVYDPRLNTWLMRLAREAARAQGLELIAVESQDLKSAVRAYQEGLNTLDPHRDALWLPQDATTVEDSTVLPMILKEAWDRNLVVFSSTLAHVKRGVLFSMYPNNVALGRTIAGATTQVLSNGVLQVRGPQPLRDVQLAVNIRTASHLGLNLSYQQQQSFDLIFPEP